MKIKEVIVVEGKNDTAALKSFFDVDTIETHGLGLSEETLKYIEEVNKKRGVILFLDPDHPGETIRRKIHERIPDVKDAFVFKEDARTKKKVGIEHASKEVLEEALQNVITFKEGKETVTMEDLFDLGLTGGEDSANRRRKVSEAFHIGECNGKTMKKRLDMLEISREELEEVL